MRRKGGTGILACALVTKKRRTGKNACATLFSLCLCLGQTPPDPILGLTPADLVNGKRLFEGQCAPCHGIAGGGGKGAILAVARLKHASDNRELLAVIREGIDGTGMLPVWQLSENELVQVAGYVRSLGRVAATTISGDPAKGKTLYQAQGCGGCHIVDGQGSSFGPELTEVGARRGAEYLRAKLVNPSDAIAEGFVMVRALARGGSEVRGFRLNEDSFTIQIKDANSRFHSLRKNDLEILEKDSTRTPMPSFAGKLSSTDAGDLVAYLASLRGGQ